MYIQCSFDVQFQDNLTGKQSYSVSYLLLPLALPGFRPISSQAISDGQEMCPLFAFRTLGVQCTHSIGFALGRLLLMRTHQEQLVVCLTV